MRHALLTTIIGFHFLFVIQADAKARDIDEIQGKWKCIAEIESG